MILIVYLQLATLSTFITALSAIRGAGMQRHFYDVCLAICDSNDTKEVKGKTLAHIKANINKGLGFVPPTLALQKIRDLYTKEPMGVK